MNNLKRLLVISLVLIGIITLTTACSTSKDKNNTSSLLNIIMSITSNADTPPLIFQGESEKWELIYVVNLKDNGERKTSQILRYKEEVNEVLTANSTDKIETKGPPVSYTIYNPFGITGGKGHLSQDGINIVKTKSCCDKSFSKDVILDAQVQWQGKTEKLKLYYVPNHDSN